MKGRSLVLALLLAIPSLAPAGEPKFLPQNPDWFLSVLPPPPKNESAEERADFDVLLKLQASRTPDQIVRAEAINEQTPFTFARPVLGDWLKPKKFPRTRAIFQELDDEIDAIVDAAKKHWARPRPYRRDGRVKPTGKISSTGSYPSGHSTNAAIWGAVWSAVFPQKAKEFQARVREVMLSRVLRGVHYPSDTEAGKTLGEAMGKAFLSGAAGRAAVAAMREEFAASERAAKAGLVP